MKRKIFLTYILTILVVFSAFGCAKNVESLGSNSPTPTSHDSYIYKSDQVSVKLLPDSVQLSVSQYELNPTVAEEVYTKNTTIITGTVSNVRQAEVQYIFMDAQCEDSITLFDMTVSKVLRNNGANLSQNDIVTVGVPFNMNSYGERLPVISEGKEFIVYCYPTSDIDNDPLELSHYVNYWANNPWELVVEKIDNCYITGDFFKDVPSSICAADIINEAETPEETLATFVRKCSDVGIQVNSDTGMFIINTIDNRVSLSESSPMVLKNVYVVDSASLESYIVNQIASYSEFK